MMYQTLNEVLKPRMVIDMNYEASENAAKINDYVLSLLPDKLKIPAKNYLSAYPGITEIRLHIDAPVVFNNSGKNIVSKLICNRNDIEYCVSRLTEGNFMKHEEVMRQGYITLKYGCRAGVCGDVFVSGGAVKVLKKVDHINIRLPSVLMVKAPDIIDYIQKNAYSPSLLIISAPGVGKTTLLRSIAYVLSTAPHNRRVSVIDTNRELALPCSSGVSICDFLTGYQKPEGISIATKYFSPEYIICDELGDKREISAILESTHSGVPIIASAHCGSFEEIYRKENLSILLSSGVFDCIVRLSRRDGKIVSEMKSVGDVGA